MYHKNAVNLYCDMLQGPPKVAHCILNRCLNRSVCSNDVRLSKTYSEIVTTRGLYTRYCKVYV